MSPDPTSPDCAAGKCHACSGDAWHVALDALTDCEHPCHVASNDPLGDLTAAFDPDTLDGWDR